MGVWWSEIKLMITYCFPVPINDETFSSWATRCSLDTRSFSIIDSDIVDWERSSAYDNASKTHSSGMEFDFESPYLTDFLSSAGLSTCRIRDLFSPSDDLLLSPAYRTAFCHGCIYSDVVQNRFPSWRKSWCYIARPYCPEHHCLLRFMNGHRGCDKQWDAFTNRDLGEFMPGRLRRRSKADHGVAESAIRARLTLRVQIWVQKVYGSAADISCRGVGPIDNQLMRTAIELMLKLTLIHRTRRGHAGIAKVAFSSFYPPLDHEDRDLPARLNNGAPNSVPYERMCALWLLGQIFKVFTAAEAALLHGMVHDAEFVLPATQSELGEMCASSLVEGESDVLSELISGLNVGHIFDPAFLEGLVGAT